MTEEKSMIDKWIPAGEGVIALLKKSGALERVRKFFAKRSAYPVLVVGSSGAGKSAFLKSMKGEPAFVERLDRTPKATSSVLELEHSYIKFIDTPGEDGHEAERKEAYRTMLSEKRFGVIHVVAHGFNEGSILTSRAIVNGKPSADYLSAQRGEELRRMTEWTFMYGPGSNAAWLLTLVTKADLWWEQAPEQATIEYYRDFEGKYATSLSESVHLPRNVRSYSSLNHLFYGQAPMSGFYSDAMRTSDHNAVVQYILERASE